MTLAIFPEMPIGWNSTKNIKWDTKVVKSASGKRKAMTTIAYPEIEIESSLVGLTQQQVEAVGGFVCARRGMLEPFLWKDPEEYKVEKLQIGAGTGSKSEYQLFRLFGGFKLPVTDIVPNTLTVYLNGTATTAFTLEDGGIIKFSAAPQTGKVITASFEYYWRVAMASDELASEVLFLDINKISSLRLVTVR